MAHFTLSWDKFESSFCNGLSSLQQNGELVDMTLAADGHLVKVHQLVMALASPYIKELIASANCPHPVIFLKSISYKTLSSLLEYIYTGEVNVSEDNIDELLEVGKELRIKGLTDMKFQTDSSADHNHTLTLQDTSNMKSTIEFVDSNLDERTIDETHLSSDQEEVYLEDDIEDNDYSIQEKFNINPEIDVSIAQCDDTANVADSVSILYTVSNQGRLQMVLNRYMYYLKYSTRKTTVKHWRCVDYLNRTKCPARLITKDNVVIKRIEMHIHPFHDKKILKKVREKTVFSTEEEAIQSVND